MFTGIVEELGYVVAVTKKNYTLNLVIENQRLFCRPNLGGSFAVNGVCLTQTRWEEGRSTFDVVKETLNKTNLGLLIEGDFVNLERSMQVGARLEGHFVQGHVDGMGHVHQVNREKNEIWIDLPNSTKPFFVEKGSVAIDGVSLTIAEVEDSLIRIALVPHTLEKTNLSKRQVGDLVNVEVDLFAKYIYKYLEGKTSQTSRCP